MSDYEMQGSETVTVHAKRQPPSSFTRKRIDVSFHIPDDSLGPTGTTDTVVLKDYRARATITLSGLRTGTQLSLRIEGMSLKLMNRLSVVQAMINVQNQISIRGSTASIVVQAGDDENGMSTVFKGMISEGYVDFTGAPNIAFQVLAWDNSAPKLAICPPSSYHGNIPAVFILSELIQKAKNAWAPDDPTQPTGVFNNYGVTDTVTNFYAAGSAAVQIDALARAIGAVYCWDVDGAFNIWPKGHASVVTQAIPVISSETGLIGYPSYNQSGISFSCLFNPHIRFYRPVQIDSNYLPAGWVNNQTNQGIPKLPATGLWTPFEITHDLSSETPGGPWFSYVSAVTGIMPQVQA